MLTAEHVDQDYIMGFLIGLNDNFEHVRTQILMIDPLPSMSRVMYLVSQHKRQTFEVLAVVKNAEGTAVLAVGFGNRCFPTKRPFCTHCHKEGHTVDKCFKLHGFPPSFKPKPRYNQVAASAIAAEVIEEPRGQFGFSVEQVQGLMAMMKQTFASSGPSIVAGSVANSVVQTDPKHATAGPSFTKEDWNC